MKAYLRLRLRILGRQLAELGWLRLLLLGGVLVLTLGKVLELLLARPALQWAAPPLALLATWPGHRRRTDTGFLQIASPAYRQWLLAEYVLWLWPVWGLLLGLGYWAAALATVVAVLPVPFLPVARSTGRRWPRRSLLRSEVFEWVSGFRQLGGWACWLAGLAVAGWQHASTVVPAVVLGGWSLLVTFCYTTPEPTDMVTIYGRGATAFWWRKLALAAVFYLLTAAPFFVLLGLSPAAWPGATALLAWGLLTVSMSVMAKYSFYPQPTLVRLTQGGIVAVALLPLLNAQYAPILVAVFGGLIWKSRQRLHLYWHA
ncbi:hypothetical protein E5K00_05365 [Hymenobacter aquaticus]|uniref:Uncharacterized protein n=1 Tax=Hymenobacter aquaticus TaxID=1867101 RepID=A0A4Z0Q4X0_9BACT|nr:hypothetical protein [Hymenobacter aquaticus]TGE24644.1 hypothetical protein E5K00_05365 [Hymenobacter aquaticus]